MKKLLDIIVPVYNQEYKIDKFLNSIVSIKYNDYINVIYVDDGSKDNSVRVITDFYGKHQDCHYNLITQSNSGVSSARNKGLDYSFSKYVWFCDPDDEILNIDDLIEILLTEGPDILTFSVLLCREIDNSKSKYSPIFECHEIGIKKAFRKMVDYRLSSNLERGNALLSVMWDKVIRRDLVKHEFDINLLAYEDAKFGVQLFLSNIDINISVKTSENIFYKYYAYASDTLSSSWDLKKEESFYSFVDWLINQNYNIDVPSFVKKEIFNLLNRSFYKNKSYIFNYFRMANRCRVGFFPLKTIHLVKLILLESRLMYIVRKLKRN